MKVRESKIPRKATTQVVIGILDELIDGFCRPLFENCDMFSRRLLQILFDYSSDSRKRFGVLPFYECAGDIICAIETRNYDLLRKSKIDRSILVMLGKSCLDILRTSIRIEVKIANRKKGWAYKRACLSRYIGCNINILASLYKWSKSYCKLYDRYIEEVYRKYEKLTIGKASYISKNSKMYVDQFQLESNLRMAIGRAIDRCDVEKGTLTYMVEKCMMTFTNNPEFGHLYGIAFTVPTNVRRRKAQKGEVISNFSVGLESQDADMADAAATSPSIFGDIDDRFMCGIKKLKNTSVALLVMGLPIVLSDSEKKLLAGNKG